LLGKVFLGIFRNDQLTLLLVAFKYLFRTFFFFFYLNMILARQPFKRFGIGIILMLPVKVDS